MYGTTNKGALFTNDRKEKETHPDYKGEINIDGKEYWLSGWKNTSKQGKTYLGLSAEPKEAVASEPAPSSTELNDEVPF